MGPIRPVPAHRTGRFQLDVQHSLFGFASLNLSKELFPKVEFDLTDLGASDAPDGFRVDLILATANKLGTLVQGFLKGGAYKTDGTGQNKVEWIEPLPDPAPVVIQGPALVIRVDGRAGQTASLEVKPRLGEETVEGIVTIQLDPPYVAFGSTGFGLGLPNGIILDDSDTEKPPPAHDADGNVVASDSDTASWRGIAIRDAQLFIPRGIPAIGGTAIPIHLELGKPQGINASITVHVPGHDNKPDITGKIEVRDPTATSLADCLPTLVELIIDLPAKGQAMAAGGGVGGVTLGGGQPLRMKANFARDPRIQPNTVSFTLGLEAIGDDGLVSVTAPDGGPAAKVFITAAVLATALIADSQFDTSPSGDASGRYLHLILTAALGVSAFFENQGGVVVHAVDVMSDGTTSSVVSVLKLRVDYSVDAMVKTFDVGVLSIGMKPHRGCVCAIAMSRSRSICKRPAWKCFICRSTRPRRKSKTRETGWSIHPARFSMCSAPAQDGARPGSRSICALRSIWARSRSAAPRFGRRWARAARSTSHFVASMPRWTCLG